MQKDALFPQRLFLIDNFAMVRRWRRMYTWHSCCWAELGWAQAETNGFPNTAIVCRKLIKPWVNSDRLKLQGPFTNWKSVLRSVTRGAVPPSLIGRQTLLRGDVRGTQYCNFSLSVFEVLVTGLDFILLRSTGQREERHPAVLLRLSRGLKKPAVIVINYVS